MATFELDCPNCKRNIISQNAGWRSTLDTPLRNCPHCNSEYLYPNIYEWSIAGPFWKFVYCFLANGRWWLMIIAIIHCNSLSWKTAIVCFVIWIAFSLLRLKLFDSKKIKESHQRTKNNPEYIQKLSDLGYTKIDIRIDPYYK